MASKPASNPSSGPSHLPDWEEDSPELRKNLREAFDIVSVLAKLREGVFAGQMSVLHTIVMSGLTSPFPGMEGVFRGETGLDTIEVAIGDYPGVLAVHVGSELDTLFRDLNTALDTLDIAMPRGQLPNASELGAVLDLCAFAHAEWIRIHPFANGNGRTARLLANLLAMRYGLPPFVRLRPRPGGEPYARAGEAAMRGDWVPTVTVFQSMLARTLDAA